MADLSYEDILALLEGEEAAPEPTIEVESFEEPSVLTPEEREVQDGLSWWMEQIR